MRVRANSQGRRVSALAPAIGPTARTFPYGPQATVRRPEALPRGGPALRPGIHA